MVHSPGGILRGCFAFTVFTSWDGWIQIAASTEVRGKDGQEWLEIMVKVMGCGSRMYRADWALLPFYLLCFLFPLYFAECLISPFQQPYILYVYCISSFPFHLIRRCLQLMPRYDCPDAIPARVVSFSKGDAAAVYIALSSIY